MTHPNPRQFYPTDVSEETCSKCGGPLEMIELPDIIGESTFVSNGECARKCWRAEDPVRAAALAVLDYYFVKGVHDEEGARLLADLFRAINANSR